VAIVDIDVCGPSVPRVMGLLNEEVFQFFFFTLITIITLNYKIFILSMDYNFKVHMSGSGWCPVVSKSFVYY
jgi:hypothetical protein